MRFDVRIKARELMDDPGISPAALDAALKDISRTNRMLNGYGAVMREIRSLLERFPQRRVVILDVGCGDGSFLRKVVRFGRSRGVTVQGIGVDICAMALDIAQEQSHDYPEIRYIQRDILRDSVEDLQADIVVSILTLHHLTDAEIPSFLQRVGEISKTSFIISDLGRSRWAYRLFRLFSVIFIRSETARYDGLISIRRGFVKSELGQFARDLPGWRHSIRWKWAFRYQWVANKR